VSAFEAMVDAQFEDPNLGLDAIWSAGGAGDGLPVRVRRRSPEAIITSAGNQFDLDAMLLDVRLSEVPEPAVDDVVGSEPLEAEAFGAAAGLTPDQLADCVQYGLLTPGADGRHPVADLPVARAAGGLARHGIEARHLRVYRSAAEREAVLLEQVVAPVLRGRTGEARTAAADTLRELAALSAQLHTALLDTRLREVLGPDLGD